MLVDRSTTFQGRHTSFVLELHPETANGATGRGRPKVRQIGEANEPERFTADTASKTGQSERAVQQDAERGEKVCAEAEREAGATSR